jgi:hypothetical protein
MFNVCDTNMVPGMARVRLIAGEVVMTEVEQGSLIVRLN